MKIKQTAKALCKIALSGFLALLTLTAFCFFYYNIPAHQENKDGTTDYKWEPKVFYSRGTEGFAWGKTNNEGFVNAIDYNENTPPIDILIMGSSQMEAYNVNIRDSVTGRLGEHKTVYNIGIAAHDLMTCFGNMEAALNKYRPKYVVLETGKCLFTDEALADAVNGTTGEIPSHSGGLVGLLQKNQYLRLVYGQLDNFMKDQADDDGDEAGVYSGADEGRNNDKLLSALMQKISSAASRRNAKVIILYHPRVLLDPDGTVRLKGSASAVEQFEQTCRENGLMFLDMSQRFTREYYENHRLPYGFSNTSVGSGHLNKYGHAMIADELYRLISETE